MGQLPTGAITLVETVADAERVDVPDSGRLAYATQTTLSVDDTAAIVSVLQRRYPTIEGPKKEDICYATTNRQQAVKAIAPRADLVLVLGAPNSSNSMRLVEVAAGAGCPNARLITSADDIDWRWFDGISHLGITAGASAPELLVEQVIDACRRRFDVMVEEVAVTREDVQFKLPRALSAA